MKQKWERITAVMLVIVMLMELARIRQCPYVPRKRRQAMLSRCNVKKYKKK